MGPSQKFEHILLQKEKYKISLLVTGQTKSKIKGITVDDNKKDCLKSLQYQKRKHSELSQHIFSVTFLTISQFLKIRNIINQKLTKMKFILVGLIGALAATSANAAQMGNLRNLQTANCLTYDNNGACTQCYFRFVLKNGQCIQVSDYCKEWNATTGACTSCYDGWQLKNGACVLPNSGCKERQVVIDGKCVDVSEQCKTWDSATGKCTSCFEGWNLKDGACVLPDDNQDDSGDSGQQPQCYYRQVPKNGKCVNVSDQCKTWDVVTGDCLSCYDGYTLSNGACKI